MTRLRSPLADRSRTVTHHRSPSVDPSRTLNHLHLRHRLSTRPIAGRWSKPSRPFVLCGESIPTAPLPTPPAEHAVALVPQRCARAAPSEPGLLDKSLGERGAGQIEGLKKTLDQPRWSQAVLILNASVLRTSHGWGRWSARGWSTRAAVLQKQYF